MLAGYPNTLSDSNVFFSYILTAKWVGSSYTEVQHVHCTLCLQTSIPAPFQYTQGYMHKVFICEWQKVLG